MDKYCNQTYLPANAPSFMIIGAQKAGTTALYTYLAQHPQIRATQTKELHFFSCERQFSLGMSHYHSLFPAPVNEGQLTFEASPSYLMSESACSRIFEYNPKMKMIVLLRNPVERAFSAWNMYRERFSVNRNWFFDEWVEFCSNDPYAYTRRDDSSLFSFNSFIKEEIETMKINSAKRIEAPVIPQGFYNTYLSRYFNRFNKKGFLIIETSELRRQSVEALKKIEKFLGVRPFDWDTVDLTPVFEGHYTGIIDEESRQILKKFYSPFNNELYKLLGNNYEWE